VDKKEYFRKLVALFEADGLDAGEPGAQAQAFAADSGQGVAGTSADQIAQAQQAAPGALGPGSSGAMSSDPALGDADYLSAVGTGVPGLPPIGDSIEVPDHRKKSKLFDLFRDLLNYSNVFVESLTNIDMNLLDMDQIDRVKKNTDQVDDVIGKIRSYIVETLPTERYEKALYVYILLRTELLTIIKLLRETLGLNVQPEAEKKNENGSGEPKIA
jgi:hypothetical protein